MQDGDVVGEHVEGREIDRAVAVEIGGDDRGGREAHCVTRAGHEAAVAVAEQHLDRPGVGDRDRDVEVAVVIEVGDRQVARAGADAERRVGDEPADDRHGAGGLADDHELGGTGGVEIGGDEAARAVADGDPLGLGQRSPALAAEDGDLGAAGQGGGDVEAAVAVEIGDREVLRGAAERPARGCPIEHVLNATCVGAAPEHADGAADVAGGDEVGATVGVEVGDDGGVGGEAPGVGAGAREIEAQRADARAAAGIGGLTGQSERADPERAHEPGPPRYPASGASIRFHHVSDDENRSALGAFPPPFATRRASAADA
ncbi:hypothetical protein OV079_11440 [Nannocystis pusilla]|uniref:Uncharacterized protein n=1 Tax=Nannocystis pusilla TaxID=889268 RepID=A0A9X3IX44_9BACT|nr:hypothetical protein [Nannocystis pusilla]MCY1006164.1 hypothetical protein [Nannocystis pusilla]